MAMHGDGCFMCSPAMDQLLEASEQLNCTRFGSPSGTKEDNQEAKNRCQKYKTLPNIAPILLQVSGSSCEREYCFLLSLSEVLNDGLYRRCDL